MLLVLSTTLGDVCRCPGVVSAADPLRTGSLRVRCATRTRATIGSKAPYAGNLWGDATLRLRQKVGRKSEVVLTVVPNLCQRRGMSTNQTLDLDSLPSGISSCRALLTVGNPKTVKGEGFGYHTAILHLAPASLSGRDVCSHSTTACRELCLNTAGRGGIGLDADGLNGIQVARIRRTRWFTSDREAFMAQLELEISRHVRRAIEHGLTPCVRLNGTSDLPWENIRYGEDGQTILEAFPLVRFYDYTKVPVRIRRRALKLPNYALTFSLAEDNELQARVALEAGLNLAVVFDTRKGQPLPTTFWGRPVVDGDLSDLRFLDAPGVIVGLRAKGRAIGSESGFVRSAEMFTTIGRIAA